MNSIRLDDEGRLKLPAELLQRLGWASGANLTIQTEGDLLLLQPATEIRGLKEEARRLADSMRSLTSEPGRPPAAETVPDAPPPPSAVPGLLSPASLSAPPGAVVLPFGAAAPQVAPSVYLAPGSTVTGDVRLDADCSLWPGAVVRGDVAPVVVGRRTNIQDGAVLHVSPQLPCRVGSGVTIGHQATLHACTVGNDVLIGIHAVVLDGALVGERCIIAAGSVVPPGMEIPPGKMVMGAPARVVRDLDPAELERIQWNADAYVSLKAQYGVPAAPPSPEPPPATERPAPPRRGEPPSARCPRAAGPIAIDGSLDDEGWTGVAPLSLLVLAEDGSPAREATEVKLCFDSRAIYVSFACKDSDVWSNFTERDAPLYDEEVVELFLCPTGDLRHYFEIELSPANVIFDARVFNPDGDRRTLLVDREWDAAGLKTAVRVSGKLNDRSSTDLGWIAELAIPFTDLGLAGPPPTGDRWRVNFYRIERGAVTEFSAWSPTFREPADFHVPSCFGEIVFE